MQITRIDQNLRVFFEVDVAGALAVALTGGNFTVTVLNPQNSAILSPAPTVAASLKLGVYYFDVPSSFFATHGVGMYSALIEIPSLPQIKFETIQVRDELAKIEASVTLDPQANLLRVNAWLMRDQGQDLTGLSNATMRLFRYDGTALIALATTASPDAQGVFAFNVAAPALAVGETATYVDLTMDKAGPPVRTYRAKVGVTFSRTS